MEQDKLFTPYRIGPLEIRNRTIRSAAFEGMAEHNSPSKTLYDYHTSVARGGIGMTTVAYAAVCRSGLSFERQLWMREEIVPALRELTDGIHAEGAKASIQLGHCGNMSHRKICGCRPLGASSGFNLYSPTFVHGMTRKEIDEVVEAYGHAVELAIQAGFDAVEIHAGHGYLISQFLSPYTNKRKDEFGGSLENRMRFMKMVMEKVVAAGKGKVAIFVNRRLHNRSQRAPKMRRGCARTFWRLRKPRAYVRDEGRIPCHADNTLHAVETVVAEIRSAARRKVSFTYGNIQEAVLPRRRKKIQGGPAGHAIGLCRRCKQQEGCRRSNGSGIRNAPDGPCSPLRPRLREQDERRQGGMQRMRALQLLYRKDVFTGNVLRESLHRHHTGTETERGKDKEKERKA